MKRDSLVQLPPALTPAAVDAPDARFVLGVDGGATKTLAAVLDLESRTLHLAHGGPSNEDAVGTRAAVQALLEAADEAIAAGRHRRGTSSARRCSRRRHRHRRHRPARALGPHRRLDRRQRRRRSVGHRDRRRTGRGGDLGHRLERLRRRPRRARLAGRRLGPSARRRGQRLLARPPVDQGGAARPRRLRARRPRSATPRPRSSACRASRRSRCTSTPSR